MVILSNRTSTETFVKLCLLVVHHFEIKRVGSGEGAHAYLGAAPCYYAIIPKLTFTTIISYSALGIGLYLFYRNENYCSIHKRTKKGRLPYFLRENEELPLWKTPVIKKADFF